VVVLVVVGMLALFAVLLATSGDSRWALAIPLGFFIVLIFLAYWLASLYIFAALILASDKLGIAKAIDPRRLYALARANHETSLHVALVYGAATLVVAGIGIAVGVIIPFSSLLISLGLPAVYAIIVPNLAAFRLEARGALSS
jgi:hypothetical protein